MLVVDDGGEGIISCGQAWEDTDRDYTYDEVCTFIEMFHYLAE